MPAVVGQWRAAPCSGILRELHAFYLAGASPRFELLTFLAVVTIYAPEIRQDRRESRDFLKHVLLLWRWECSPSMLKSIKRSEWYTMKIIDNLGISLTRILVNLYVITWSSNDRHLEGYLLDNLIIKNKSFTRNISECVKFVCKRISFPGTSVEISKLRKTRIDQMNSR